MTECVLKFKPDLIVDYDNESGITTITGDALDGAKAVKLPTALDAIEAVIEEFGIQDFLEASINVLMND